MNFLHDQKRKYRLLKQVLVFIAGLLLTYGFWIFGSSGHLAVAPAVAEAQISSSSVQPSTKPPKVVFFGSSTNVGVGSTRGDRRYSTLLSRYLGWEEYNESLSGSSLSKAPRTDKSWPIPSAVERWKDAVLRRHPDRVLMLYGANDAYWKLPLGNPQSPKPATFRGDLKTLLSEMRQSFRPDQLIVVTPQPNRATASFREAYDLALRDEAQDVGAPFINSTQDSELAKDLDTLSADGLHLNNLGHAAYASYLAGKLVDLGLAPTPPVSEGGNALLDAQLPLKGNAVHIDLANPLTFGEIREISARWVAPGKARFILFRPDGQGGYDALYRTELFDVTPGVSKVFVPRWWVLNGDRLGAWTDSDCLGSEKSSAPHQLMVERSSSSAVTDVLLNEGKKQDSRLAIWINAYYSQLS